MAHIDLAPLAKTDEGLRSWLDLQFKRIVDAADLIPPVEYGIDTVTGELEVETGLVNCLGVTASFVDPPVAGACFLRAIPISVLEKRGLDFGNINLKVWDNAFVVSSTPIRVGWIAVGSDDI